MKYSEPLLNSRLKEVHEQTCEIKNELKSIEETEKVLGDKVEKIEADLNSQELDQKVKALQGAITKTYLTLWFNSEGATPTSIVIRLQEIGFKPTRGKYDFMYDWKRQTALEEIFKLGDTVRKTLKGSKVLYKLETS